MLNIENPCQSCRDIRECKGKEIPYRAKLVYCNVRPKRFVDREYKGKGK